jgi:hypothetical protein
MVYHSLPLDIIHVILSYNDTLKLRNGKYMNRIQKDDTRYDLLLNITQGLLREYSNSYFDIIVTFSNNTELHKIFSEKNEFKKSGLTYSNKIRYLYYNGLDHKTYIFEKY